MDKLQAEAIAQAILAPQRKEQAALARRRAALALARQRRIAWAVLFGFAVGTLVARLFDERLTGGGLYGALASAALCGFIQGLRGQRAGG